MPLKAEQVGRNYLRITLVPSLVGKVWTTVRLNRHRDRLNFLNSDNTGPRFTLVLSSFTALGYVSTTATITRDGIKKPGPKHQDADSGATCKG